MKFNSKKLNGTLAALGMVTALLMCSQMAVASSYQSSTVLPTIHSKGYLYTANVPVSGSPPANGKISNVTWNWGVVGWPSGLSVHLCHGANLCKDISRQRSGSITDFNNRNASQGLYYAVRVVSPGRVPLAGQHGNVTVSW